MGIAADIAKRVIPQRKTTKQIPIYCDVNDNMYYYGRRINSRDAFYEYAADPEEAMLRVGKLNRMVRQ